MIEVTHLSRRYGSSMAVDDVSFSIAGRGVVGLLGHNGAGKTTLMKMLTGFLASSAGSIRVDGLEMGPDTQAIQRRIGYLPENCPVWPDMSVFEFLEYQASLHGLAAADRPTAIREAVGRTALGDKVTARIQTLSRGYRQRLGVAQAILHNPDIVILDEPTSGLDPTQIQQMRALIRDLGERSVVIVSTHILQEVAAVCQRVMILRRGRKVLDTPLDELQRGARLLVTLDRAEPEAGPVLRGLAGVESVSVEPGPDGCWIYALQAPTNLAPAVAAAAQAAGFALHALMPERRDLETVFTELNSADGDQNAPSPTPPGVPGEAPQLREVRHVA